jgi:hypothetical protein
MANFAFEPQDLGIVPLTVQTWDPTLHRDLRVLVPVHVDALVVRSRSGRWADCRMRRPGEVGAAGDGSPRSLDLLPAPFADQPEAREPGVYLHWALPDGLADVRPDGSTAALRALPDRWLVARIGPGGPAGRAVTAWVLDARAGSLPVPLDFWRAAPPSGKPVTMLGIGDAGWAAYYDNVANRFAFFDPSTDLPSGPLAYLVCGWYADAAADPLAVELHSLAEFQAHLAGLGWELSQADLARAEAEAKRRTETFTLAGLPNPHGVRSLEGDVVMAKEVLPLSALGKPLASTFTIAPTHWPRASLFHGSVVGLSWPNAAAGSPEVGGPPDPRDVEVALGATPADALATLVAHATGAPRDGEWLTAFALGALDELSQPDGDVRLDDRLHEAAFASRSDGTEKVRRPPSVLPESKPQPPKPGRPDVATGLAAGAEAAGVVELTKLASESRLTQIAAGETFAAATSRPLNASWMVEADVAFHQIHLAPERPPIPESTEIELPRPRLFLPAEPVIAIQGGLRSPKHGLAGRLLFCRLSGTAVALLSARASAAGARAVVRGNEVLARPLAHGGIPPECDELLAELGLLDPGSAGVIADRMARGAGVFTGPAPLNPPALTRTVATEQTAWWALRNPDVDAHAVLAHSGFGGTLPSPVAVRPANKPWVPLHLDWEVELRPTPAAAWSPGEIDFAPPAVPAGPGEIFRGRSLLSAGIASALAQSLRKYLAAEEIVGGSRLANAGRAGALTGLAAQLETLDVLAGPLEHFHLKLRRDVEPDAAAVATPPAGFVAVRAGFLKIRRLRLVDAFGQVVYLAGSGPGDGDAASDARISVGTGIDVPGAPGTLALPPRFTAPAKLSFRFRDAGQPAADATGERSPVCGWLMPDHLDGALEVFDAEGNAVGQLRHDPDHGAVWELAPGRPTAVGASPREAIPHPEVGAMTAALLALGMADAKAGRVPALLELLRVVDSTRWTIDPFGHVGEEHLALLIGHPIAVVAATIQIEVREPVAGTDVPVTRVPVRLGALSHWQDGLFGYFAAGDYQRFRCAAAAAFARPGGADGFLGPIGAVPDYAARFAADVSGDAGATPVVHPYIDTSGVLWVVPGIEVPLLLLLEPHAVVYATTGLLPRKQLGVLREWMAPALARMAPTFRFGPVLRDPKQIRMPIPADIGAAWTWTHRADVDRWQEEDVVHAGHEALLPPDPAEASEGWLKLAPKEPEKA